MERRALLHLQVLSGHIHVKTTAKSCVASHCSASTAESHPRSASSATRPPMRAESQRLRGKVAMVIGASSRVRGDVSIGVATAMQFAREGATVVCVARGEDGLKAVVDTIRGEGGVAEAYAADALDSQSMKAAVEFVVKKFGKLDILHHNLGGSGPGDGGVEVIDEKAWLELMTLNAFSPMVCIKHAAPQMVRQGGGSIITTSSIMGSRVMRQRIRLAYSMSKAALEELTKNVAIEFAKKGVRCNCISPGQMWGPIVYAQFKDDQQTLAKVEQFRDASIPTGKQGTPWDCALMAVYLASDESKYVNGQILQVDGGYSITSP